MKMVETLLTDEVAVAVIEDLTKVTFEELDEEEKHAIIQGREDFKNGDTFSDDEIDWGNLDKMNLE